MSAIPSSVLNKPFIGPLTLEETIRHAAENNLSGFDIVAAFARHVAASRARRAQLHDAAIEALDLLEKALVSESR